MSLRVFHTADWHLGQTFHAFDRDYEHGHFLAWLLETLAERKPDALLVAGDIFDTINPSAAAQKRYFGFLAEARRRLPELQIVITAGNHDAGSRLEASSPVVKVVGASVVGTVPRNDSGAIDAERFIVPLRNAAGAVEALVLAVPFLRPADVPVVEGAKDPYVDGIRELYRQAAATAESWRDREHPDAALIALGHLHLGGAEESRDSERRLVIGGVEVLGPDIFPASLVYVALGHLHKPQGFEQGRIVYSGSPLPLSFSERAYEHRVLELTFDGCRLQSTMVLRVPRAVELLRVPESGAALAEDLPALLNALPLDATKPCEEHPFLEIHVAEDRPNPGLRQLVERALVGKAVRLALIKRVSNVAKPTALSSAAPTSVADLTALQPDEILRAHHRERFGTELDDVVLQALREIVVSTP